MATLHNPQVRATIRARVAALTPGAQRRWGKMTVDQMLWHVSEALHDAIDGGRSVAGKPPMPRVLLRFAVLRLPWPKGAPTNPSFITGERHDFAAEQRRCLSLIDRFGAKDIDGPWPLSSSFGAVDGRFMSRLQAKHLDHHLKQFSA